MASAMALSAAAAVPAFSTSSAESGTPGLRSSEEWRPLSSAELSETIGGVSTDTISPSSQTSAGNDNIGFDIDWTNITVENLSFGIFADNTKTAAMNAPANSSGTWRTRTYWPLSGYKTLRTKYYLGETWTTSLTSAQHRVSPSLHMVNIRVWNTTIDGITTAVTHAQFSGLIDNLNRTYSWNTTNSVDAIYGQCTTSQRLQLRFTGVSSTTLSNCDYPIPSLSGSAPYYGIPSACIDEMVSDASGSNDIDIFILNNMGDRGWHLRGASTSNPTWHAIGVLESWVSDPGFVRTLAHEIGHWVLYPDSAAHAPTYNCGGAGEPACGSNKGSCGMRLSGGARVRDCSANNNIMCAPTASFCGRAITSTQCSGADGDWPSYYVDQN